MDKETRYKALIKRNVDGTFDAFVGKIVRDGFGQLKIHASDTTTKQPGFTGVIPARNWLKNACGFSKKEIGVVYMFGDKELNRKHNKECRERKRAMLTEKYGMTPEERNRCFMIDDVVKKISERVTLLKKIVSGDEVTKAEFSEAIEKADELIIVLDSAMTNIRRKVEHCNRINREVVTK